MTTQFLPPLFWWLVGINQTVALDGKAGKKKFIEAVLSHGRVGLCLPRTHPAAVSIWCLHSWNLQEGHILEVVAIEPSSITATYLRAPLDQFLRTVDPLSLSHAHQSVLKVVHDWPNLTSARASAEYISRLAITDPKVLRIVWVG